MTNDSSRIFIDGRDLDRHFEAQDALIEFAKLFRDESNDRAMVIVGAAFIEAQLEHVLLTFLVDDEEEVKELFGTYAGRTRALYCLGLIGPMVRDDLRLVAKIRNRFAHRVNATFQDQEIKSWCTALKFHREVYMEPPPGVTARDLFNVGVNQLVGYLGGIVSIVRGEKRQLANL